MVVAGVEAAAMVVVMVVVMVVASTSHRSFAAADAITAIVGAAPSAGIDDGPIGVRTTLDLNRTMEIRCPGRSGAPDFVFGDRIARPGLRLRQPSAGRDNGGRIS